VAIGNALQPDAAALCQPFSAIITMPCQVWSRWTYPLPYYGVFAAATLLYAATLTFELWPWTFAVYRLWHDETLDHIWTQLSNPRRSNCDLNVLPNDLEHVLRIALGCGIIFTKFDLRQLISAWILAIFNADTLCHAVTCWPWKFVVYHALF